MKTIALGPNKIPAPALIQGLMRTDHMSIQDLGSLLDTDLEHGLTYLDTSDIYSEGVCEELLGETFAKRPGLRESFSLQTKCGIRMSSKGFNYYDFSEEYILEAADASLRRLHTDHIDYYLLHRPDALFEPEEVASAFDKLAQSGKVLHFGVSNMNTSQFKLLQSHLRQPIEVNQLQFTVTHTSLVDADICVNRVESQSYDHDQGILNYCRQHDCTIQAWSPFRATKSEFTGNLIDRFARKIETRPFLGSAEFPLINSVLDGYAKEYGVSSAAIVIAWILRHPAEMQIVLGSSKPERILDAAKGLEISLSRETWYDIYRAAGNVIP